MKIAVFCVGLAALVGFVPVNASADPLTVPITVSTSGTFHCLTYAPCFAGEGTSQILITNGAHHATVNFTGVTETFQLTNALSPVTLGTFDVSGTAGFTFPTNHANPELPILLFRFSVVNAGGSDGQWWGFGPGGGTQLPMQMGLFNVSVPTDTDPSPWSGMNFGLRQPVLQLNASTALTADAGLVPEPSTLLLIGSGLGGLLARRRRQAKDRQHPAP